MGELAAGYEALLAPAPADRAARVADRPGGLICGYGR